MWVGAGLVGVRVKGATSCASFSSPPSFIAAKDRPRAPLILKRETLIPLPQFHACRMSRKVPPSVLPLEQRSRP